MRQGRKKKKGASHEGIRRNKQTNNVISGDTFGLKVTWEQSEMDSSREQPPSSGGGGDGGLCKRCANSKWEINDFDKNLFFQAEDALIGICVGAAVAALAVGFILLWCYYRRRRRLEEERRQRVREIEMMMMTRSNTHVHDEKGVGL